MDSALHRAAPSQPQEVVAASQYLHQRLHERRTRTDRPKRSRRSDFGPRTTVGQDDDIFLAECVDAKAPSRFYDSSPLAPLPNHASSDAGDAASTSRRRNASAKQLDEQLDRLTKQNFDLKLELDHRRAHQAKLHAQVESMQTTVDHAEHLRDEHAELLRINTMLVEELEKRDKAMQEAVDIICDLEERVEDMEEDRHSATRPSTAQADSGYAGTETHEHAPPSSPPDVHRAPKTPSARNNPPPAATMASQDLNRVLNDATTPARPKREPLFLSQKKPSTTALRRVFLETGKELHPVKSFNSILSKRNSTIDGDAMHDDALHSPRLSVLSESSFPSIYSPRKISPEKHAWEPEDDNSPSPPLPTGSHSRQDSISRISQWIDGHDRTEETPSKSGHVVSPPANAPARSTSPALRVKAPHDDRFQSLNDALSSAGIKDADGPASSTKSKPHTVRSSGSIRQPRTPTSFGGPIFGEPMLPPTPDSASTRMLRASRSSVLDETSLLDTTPANIKGFAALEPSLRTAPKQMRSSFELSGAYASNLEYRKTGLSNVHLAEESGSDEEDGFDGNSDTIRDFSIDYEGFPDGGSILLGTPSRFLKHTKPPAGDLFFDGNDLSSPEAERPPRRRKSSSEATPSPRKPSLGRAETSPTVLSSLRTMIAPRSKSPGTGEVTSPRSYQSTSSSSRTVLRPLSPEAAAQPAQRPARPTLTQKTQQLFRRLSGSHGSDRDREHKERQTSPSPTRPILPTLTSTPSSAYVNVMPKEARRGIAGHGADGSRASRKSTSTDPSRSSASISRPAMPSRTRTEPAAARYGPTPASERERHGVVDGKAAAKNMPGLDRSRTVGGSGGGRRESSKDAASSRQAWK